MNPLQKKSAVERNMQKLRHSTSGQYLGFVLGFLLLGAMFLTSSLWVPALTANNAVAATAIGNTQDISATAKLILRYWDYSINENKMEIGFDVDVLDDLSDSLTVSAFSSKGENRKSITAELVGCWEQKLFVTLSDVPERYDTITLTIHNETDKTDHSTAQFSCSQSVHQVSELTRKSITDFRVYAIDLMLKDLAVQDQQYTTDITETQQQYHTLEERIAALEKEKQFQTTSEQKSTESKQTAIQNQQNTLLQHINSIAASRREIQEKTDVLTKKKEAILSGEF